MSLSGILGVLITVCYMCDEESYVLMSDVGASLHVVNPSSRSASFSPLFVLVV